MAFARIPLLLAFVYGAAAKQPSAPSPISAPLRELPWSPQLNILHTTDTHGWFAGHLQEAQYAADWGDYISFASHLRKRADDDGSDLLIVDTGDRVEGNGLYDASSPKGKYMYDIVKQQKIDVITIGNHELYQRNTSIREFQETVPNFKDSYLSSNVDIFDPESGKQQALARRYRKFTTKNQGIRVLAMGFLFNFKGNANNTVVQNVKDTIKEQWFQDAIREKDVDLFLVSGHVPVRDSEEFEQIYKAIRGVQWDTPIVFFGGHTHIRDYRKFEKKAWALESGRYMETLGFLSLSGIKTGKSNDVQPAASLDYRRLYIDNNLYSLHHHSGTNKSSFDTELGRNVSKLILEAREKLELDHTFGCVPQTLWLNRAPYPSDDSMISWVEKDVLPDTFSSSKRPTIVLTNTGALRFDLFKGPFTVDSTFLVSPFTSGFRKLKDIPYGAASQVLKLLNNEGPILLEDMIALGGEKDGWGKHSLQDLQPPRPPVGAHQRTQAIQMMPFPYPNQVPFGDEDSDRPLTPGYTTKDDAGDDGDDTIHQPIQFYDVPNCVGASIGFNATSWAEDPSPKPEKVDLVYNEFIQDWVILALKYLGVNHEREDTVPALDGKTMTDVIKGWVKENWKCKD